jgi:hypothetical protein
LGCVNNIKKLKIMERKKIIVSAGLEDPCPLDQPKLYLNAITTELSESLENICFKLEINSIFFYISLKYHV